MNPECTEGNYPPPPSPPPPLLGEQQLAVTSLLSLLPAQLGEVWAWSPMMRE